MGAIRRTDWLPVGGDPAGGEQVQPSVLSDTDSDAPESELASADGSSSIASSEDRGFAFAEASGATDDDGVAGGDDAAGLFEGP